MNLRDKWVAAATGVWLAAARLLATFLAIGVFRALSDADGSTEIEFPYLVRPVVGAVLGAVTVMAVVAGLLSKQAMEKFKELVAVLFDRPEDRTVSVEQKIKAVRSLEAGGELTEEQAKTKVGSLLKLL